MIPLRKESSGIDRIYLPFGGSMIFGRGADCDCIVDINGISRKHAQVIVYDPDIPRAQALILDLRRNGGGSLTEAIDLTGLFIDPNFSNLEAAEWEKLSSGFLVGVEAW
jgi:pSer/pThr/pTyr-binding forkhead associated (FHA) protein